MTSRILTADTDAIARAAELLRDGELVAFPTETVYGLGADATSAAAVEAIFTAKGRPARNPLIAHVADAEAARREALFDDRAERLAARFWPGPLTLVLPRSAGSSLVPAVSAGLDTVALRVPSHVTALALLQAAGVPVAAPSANPSGYLSPTTAEHVADALGERVALILDGGACPIGLESTVVDLSGPTPRLLRPGAAPRAAIEAEVGPLAAPTDEAARSPGMLESHYAPHLPLRLNAERPLPGEAFLGFGPGNATSALNLSPAGDLDEAAANLYAMLHALDRAEFTGIAVMSIPDDGAGTAINDRLRRGAAAASDAPAQAHG